MPRWLRWTGRLLAGLVLLIVLAVVAVYVVSSVAIRRTPPGRNRLATSETNSGCTMRRL